MPDGAAERAGVGRLRADADDGEELEEDGAADVDVEAVRGTGGGSIAPEAFCCVELDAEEDPEGSGESSPRFRFLAEGDGGCTSDAGACSRGSDRAEEGGNSGSSRGRPPLFISARASRTKAP